MRRFGQALSSAVVKVGGAGSFRVWNAQWRRFGGRVNPEGESELGGGQHHCRAENRYEALHP